METEQKIYDSTMSVLRSDYRSKGEYEQAYQDACNHYGYKVRVEGGWKFFELETDYRTWLNQK